MLRVMDYVSPCQYVKVIGKDGGEKCQKALLEKSLIKPIPRKLCGIGFQSFLNRGCCILR